MNKENIVFIPNVNLGDNRANSYHYSVNSWQKWCDKNGTKLIEWTEPIMDVERFPIIYQREWVFDILDHNDINYNQVLIIDTDTIVHPDCPNFFEKTNNEYTAVVSNGCFEWVNRSINAWANFMFDDFEPLKVWEYVNTGFIIANKKHKSFFQKVQNFYLENVDKLYEIRHSKLYDGLPIPSTGQTCVNFLRKKHNIETTYLPERYNFTDLYRKNLLHIDPTNWWPDTLDNLFKSGWVYHFNSIPQNRMNRNAEYWLERVYKELYG